jgi:hypothetical protein
MQNQIVSRTTKKGAPGIFGITWTKFPENISIEKLEGLVEVSGKELKQQEKILRS